MVVCFESVSEGSRVVVQFTPESEFQTGAAGAASDVQIDVSSVGLVKKPAIYK